MFIQKSNLQVYSVLKTCVASTAFFQPLYNFSLSPSSIFGSNFSSNFQFLAISSLLSQNPTAKPAKYAAPKAVVS